MSEFKLDERVWPFIAPFSKRLAVAAQLVADDLEIDEVERIFVFGLREANEAGLRMQSQLQSPDRNDAFLGSILFIKAILGVIEAGLAWAGKAPIDGGVGPLSKDPEVQHLWVILRELTGPIQ
jgi:hypothetical protein